MANNAQKLSAKSFAKGLGRGRSNSGQMFCSRSRGQKKVDTFLTTKREFIF